MSTPNIMHLHINKNHIDEITIHNNLNYDMYPQLK
jgi:hypothetical protein